jgi:signal transduction histidine kinase
MLTIRTQPSLSRDFALLSLFILFILVIVSGWVTVETVKNYRRDVAKQMESESLRLDRALIVEIENASYILESLGRQIQAGGPDNQDAIAQLFFSFAKTDGPKRGIFSWATRDQMITVSSNLGVLKTPIDVADRDYMKKSVAEPWKVHIGRPIDGRLSQKWILPLSLGLTDSNGTYAGSVVVALDTEKLANDVGRTLKDSGVRFAITNTALTLLTQIESSQHFYTATFDPKQLAQIDFDKKPSGMLTTGSLFSSKQSYAYYERSSQYPYVIFLGLDPHRTRAALRMLLLPRLLQLVVIAVFLLFVLYTVRRRIIQPVIQLTGRTATIVRGERFDETQTNGPLEIEQLSHEIKRLSDFIEERRRIENELRLKNTELNRIKEAAQLTNQVKAEFFAYVGEQLTEPTEMILEQIETIKDQHFGPLGSPLYGQHAYEVHEHAQQLLAMLADIKAISEAETGLLALNENDVDLAFVLQKTARIFRDKNPGNIDVQLDLNPGLPRLRGDELRIKQMILNILQASARHLNSSDVIRIASGLRAQELSLSFSYVSNATADSGRLKSLGTLVSSASRTKHGLELALARLLIAMHQGTLEMKTTQDRTTTVTVRFPAIRVI